MLIVTHKGFDKAFSAVSRCCGTSLQALDAVLVEASKEGVTLTGTNLRMSVRLTIPGDVLDPGVALVPKGFGDWLGKVKDDVTLRGDDNALVGMSTWAKRRVPLLSPQDFPVIHRASGEPLCVVEAADIHRGLSAGSAGAGGADEYPLWVSSVRLEIEPGRLRFVSTDGRKLCLCDSFLEENNTAAALIPIREVPNILRLLPQEGPVGVHVEGQSVHFSYPGGLISVQQVEAKFPEYRRIIPEGGDITAECDSEALRDALRRLAVVTDKTTRLVTLDVDNTVLLLSARSQEGGEGEETLEAKTTGKLHAGWNSKLLQEVVAPCSGMVSLRFGGPQSPVVVSNDGYLGLLAPVGLQPEQ